MPSTIPYDPSLELGSVISQDAIERVNQVTARESKIDSAEENLNAQLAAKRSLEKTKNELASLRIDTKDLQHNIDKIEQEIGEAAKGYAIAKMEEASRLVGPKQLPKPVESPVDYRRTETKTMPLVADATNISVQFFPADKYKSQDFTMAEAISAFVSASTKPLGTRVSAQMSSASKKQCSILEKQQTIRGTLVIAISCIHKNASILAPLALNADKSVKAFNALYPGNQIPTKDRASLALLVKRDDDGKDKMTIVSGKGFGSGFVAMVHIPNGADNSIIEGMSALATSHEDNDVGSGFGASLGGDIKSVLSSHNISPQVTMICMGDAPSIFGEAARPDDALPGSDKFAAFNPESAVDIGSMTDALGDIPSFSASHAPSSAKKLLELKTKSAADVDSMAAALDDYLKKAASNDSGVPISLYLKDFTRQSIAQLWLGKYFPSEFLAISSDEQPKRD